MDFGPNYDTFGRLSRAGAIAAIKAGGSVIIAGKMISRVEALPGPADFAYGDKAAEAAARKELEDMQTRAAGQLAVLDRAEEERAEEEAKAKKK